jgi:hypothetical protein
VLLGHKKLDTTALYTRVALKALARDSRMVAVAARHRPATMVLGAGQRGAPTPAFGASPSHLNDCPCAFLDRDLTRQTVFSDRADCPHPAPRGPKIPVTPAGGTAVLSPARGFLP